MPNNNDTQNSNHNFLDVIRLLMSFAVIAIHIQALSSYSRYLDFGISNVLARIAVPFFFICSGYFFFRKAASGESGNLYKYIKNIIRLYMIWTIIYSPVILHVYAINDTGLFYDLLIFLRNIIFTSSYWQLWFLPALVFAITLVFFLSKALSKRKMLLIAFILYCIGLTNQSYYGFFAANETLHSILSLYDMLFVTTRNGLFMGFIFVAIGYYFARQQIRIKIEVKTALVCLLISFLLLTGEAFLLGYFDKIKAHDMYLAIIPVSFFLFYISLNIKLKNHAIFLYLRKMSAIIFYSHTLFLYIYNRLSISDNSLVKFIAVACAATFFSALVLLLESKKRLSWLKALH